jgi:hypothetical protein
VFDPLSVTLPASVLSVVVISVGVLVGSAVVNAFLIGRPLSSGAVIDATRAGLFQEDGESEGSDWCESATPPHCPYGLIIGKREAVSSSWSDVVKGDVGPQAAYLDVGRVQFLTTTMVSAGVLAALSLRALYSEATEVTIPALPGALVMLLGLSAVGYLGLKIAAGVGANR